MLPVRQRPRQLEAIDFPLKPKNGTLPLSGTCICLSGISDKESLHSLILELGGRVARDWHLQVSHLIVNEPQGQKYDAAVQYNQQIVSPEWLQACSRQGTRVSENDYRLASAFKKRKLIGFSDKLQRILQHDYDTRDIFAHSQFYFVANKTTSDDDIQVLKRLIRRGMGVSFAEIHDDITHILVPDNAVERNEVSNICAPDALVVNLDWILATWEQNAWANPLEHTPRYISHKTSTKTNQTELLAVPARRLFRGALFCCWNMGIDSNLKERLEELIPQANGRLLTASWVKAVTSKNQQQTKLPPIYAVCWNGIPTEPQWQTHQLLGPVRQHVTLVTPLWLKTCLTHGEILGVLAHPAFTEQNIYHQVDLKICLSQFQDLQRMVLEEVVQLVGSLDNVLRKQTQVLICRQAQGPKYEAACTHRIPVVSEEWIWHVAANGFTKDSLEKFAI